jgi:putative glutamine amidotransferase
MVARRPVIAITTSAATIPIDGEPLDVRYAPTVYDRAIERAGALPLHVPPLTDGLVNDVLRLAHGIVLSGGGDVDPVRYGEEPAVSLDDPDPERDGAESVLVHQALAHGTPVLGICRGMQLLNVSLGGTLVQDLAGAGERDHHLQTIPALGPTHRVRLQPGSRLAAAFEREWIDVNSIHHQAVRTVGNGLAVTAWSEDGVPEALELVGNEHPWVAAVQWHPEAMESGDELQRRLFRAFVEAAAAR